MKKWILTALLFLSAHTAFAQYFDYSHPELEWKSFDTEHFTFHFHQGTERTAFLAAQIIEDIYPAVTGLYDYEPVERIHVIIKDTDDYSNGAAYFFNNKMEIWATNLDYVMRGTKNWLRDVITHEFIHMVSIQKTVKSNLTFPYGFFQLFGYEEERRKDVVRGFPNVLVSYPVSSINMPVWFAEGVSQYQSNAKRFDYRDPHREMIIRDRILNEQMLTYNEMSVFGKTSHGNESSYNLGFSFSTYLADRFGEKIFSDITAISSRWNSYTFDGVLEEATGLPVDTLYANWKDSLTTVYLNRTETIRANMVKGTAIEKQGFGNLYPAFSPDARKIAYVSNRGEDYFGQNFLIVYDRDTGEAKEYVSKISSSLSWSPDGRYIAFARQDYNENKSLRNDLFLLDLKEEETHRITWGMRASNPAFSNDGRKLAFVTSTNGLHALNILTLPEEPSDDEHKTEIQFDIETGVVTSSSANILRPASYLGSRFLQLVAFQDGRQVYHPRWRPGDEEIVFDTSTEYGRNIGRYSLENDTFDLLLEDEEELRYPAFRGDDPNTLYYSASSTGIYNLYKRDLNSGKTELLTNVTGGAFMPSIASSGEIVYSCYDSIGYHIYLLENPQPIDPQRAQYDPGYPENVPDKNFDDGTIQQFETRPHQRTFTGTQILPRLLIDYGTIKPGFYVVSSDVLDEMSLVAGGAVNSDLDYDLYGYFSYRELGPELFLEAYNSTANISDTLSIKRGENRFLRFKRNVNFNLLQFRAGASFKLWNAWDVSLSYVRSLYSAKLDPATSRDTNGDIVQIPTIRYDYLRGHEFQATISQDALRLDRFREISPSGGYYYFARYRYQRNDFIQGFATDRQLGLEDFKLYEYHQLEFSGEAYFKNPLLPSHALGFKLNGGFIDKPVDSFFNFFAGGLLGLRGYPYYSIEGRHILIGGLTYRLPLSQNLDWKLGHIIFDKAYLGAFYEIGNAFNASKFSDIDPAEFKRDVGVELRLDTFSYNLFPTRIFVQAAYPLDEVTNADVVYPKEWRFYGGVLFEFDLRERLSPSALLRTIRR